MQHVHPWVPSLHSLCSIIKHCAGPPITSKISPPHRQILGKHVHQVRGQWHGMIHPHSWTQHLNACETFSSSSVDPQHFLEPAYVWDQRKLSQRLLYGWISYVILFQSIFAFHQPANQACKKRLYGKAHKICCTVTVNHTYTRHTVLWVWIILGAVFGVVGKSQDFVLECSLKTDYVDRCESTLMWNLANFPWHVCQLLITNISKESSSTNMDSWVPPNSVKDLMDAGPQLLGNLESKYQNCVEMKLTWFSARCIFL